jgi:glycosyltransferase involved in cell wall biosynthesis
MHVLVDALSVNNLSGRHVLGGHLRELAAGAREARFTLLTGAANDSLFPVLPDGVARHRTPVGAGWLRRLLWQRHHGPRLCRELRVDAVFSPSGMLSVGFPRPQLVLAQNPWPLVANGEDSASMLKSALQRRAFASAQRKATVMAFNSDFMRGLYGDRFGARAGPSLVVHQGIEEELFAKGAAFAADGGRAPQVLCVSVMARHKAVEVLVEAFARVHVRIPGSRLALVGGWPDAAYRLEIETQLARLGLNDAVRIAGHVPESELHALYGAARVFCLPSRCESFGIPAVEAQAFGTPALVTAGTAAPEIVGAGGLSVGQDDAAALADALERLLGDEDYWLGLSQAARRNAENFHWRDCSAPLIGALRSLGAGRG